MTKPRQPNCAQPALHDSGEDLKTYTWADYNIAKLEWLRAHRDATPEQIDTECSRLVREMGL